MIAQFDTFEINPIHSGDAWKLCDFIIANQDRLQRYFPKTIAQNLTPTLSEIFVNKKAKQFKNKEEFLFTLKHIQTREISGIIYIKDLNWSTNQGEFAYCIGYTFKGKGITTKAIKFLIEYAFTELHLKTLKIIVHNTNKSSIKVAKTNGFKWIKTLENEFTPIGENPLNMELYKLFK
ncbi:GNAT family N-acetyltransferase [uncultured Olleya sp.]|uniref:GNAT family N-acetyltransferase n=1 Tax=uncultured Olleya sp. TaxID=757243 RepID=UPI002591FD71|nr:GNAT family N-acetyltransferase [uncultured Olleya sp.]